MLSVTPRSVRNTTSMARNGRRLMLLIRRVAASTGEVPAAVHRLTGSTSVRLAKAAASLISSSNCSEERGDALQGRHHHVVVRAMSPVPLI